MASRMKCGPARSGTKTCRAGGKEFKLRGGGACSKGKRCGRKAAPSETRFSTQARYACTKGSDGKFRKPCRLVGSRAETWARKAASYSGKLPPARVG